jgi:hypothetical protein
VLPQVPGQVQQLGGHLGQQAGARVAGREARLGQVGGQILAGADPVGQVAGDVVEVLLGEAQGPPGVPHRHARPVGDHVGGHPRAARAVLAIDVLDHLLAPITRGEIQIDVRHAIAGVAGALHPLLRQEPLEQQLHPHRVDGGDPQGVAGGGVGRRAAPLHHDALAPGELDDVPDHQEVAGQPQLADHMKLVGQLPAGLLVQRPVALGRALPGHRLQEALLGLPRGDRIAGEGVTQVGQGELAAVGQVQGGPQGVRAIAEQRRHLGRGLEVALGVPQQAPANLIDVGLRAGAGQHVLHPALLGPGVVDVVGGHQRDPQGLGPGGGGPVAAGLLVVQVALELGVDPTWSKDPQQLVQVGPGRRPHQGHQPPRVLLQLLVAGRPFALGPAVLHDGQQPAQVLVAGAIQDQQQDRIGPVQGHLGAHQGTQPTSAPGRAKEPGSPIKAVPVTQRQRFVTQRGGRGRQILGK